MKILLILKKRIESMTHSLKFDKYVVSFSRICSLSKLKHRMMLIYENQSVLYFIRHVKLPTPIEIYVERVFMWIRCRKLTGYK